MDILKAIFSHPVVWGLLLGLVFALWAVCAGWSAKRALRRELRGREKEIARLSDHIRTQTELSAAGQRKLLDENAALKEANGNLQISLAAFQSKPDKGELRQLYLYDKAVRFMNANAPGFAIAWENALAAAQAELDTTSSGILPFIRRFIHPSLSAPSAPPPASLPPPPDAPAS